MTAQDDTSRFIVLTGGPGAGKAVRTYETMVRTYGDYGYELVEVPRAPIDERVQFILNCCSLAPRIRRPS